MFMNETEPIGLIMKGLTVDVTGSWLMTLMLIFLFVILIAVVMRVSFELIIILLNPLILVMMSYNADFLVIGIIWLVMDAIIIAKNILIK